jgi:hypothetical protein
MAVYPSRSRAYEKETQQTNHCRDSGFVQCRVIGNWKGLSIGSYRQLGEPGLMVLRALTEMLRSILNIGKIRGKGELSLGEFSAEICGVTQLSYPPIAKECRADRPCGRALNGSQ